MTAVLALVCGVAPCVSGGTLALAQQPVDGDRPCVCYRTHIEIFLAHNVEAMGRNCRSRVIWESEPGGERRRILVEAPVIGFESGSKEQDRVVAETLGGTDSLPISLVTEWMDAEKMTPLYLGEALDLVGVLTIQGRSYPVNLHLQGFQTGGLLKIRADVATSFSSLGMNPPRYGPGGIFARVKNDLELWGEYSVPSTVIAAFRQASN